jgi:hypothetical protein
MRGRFCSAKDFGVKWIRKWAVVWTCGAAGADGIDWAWFDDGA